MFNTNWPLNHNTSTANVDWSALADTWMQQREQQVHWQQAPLPLPPPPPQFLLGAPPIPPPGPPPIGMTFPPLPPTQLGMAPHHHQLQVGSNTTQESLTMTNIENVQWRPPPPPPPPPPFVMSGGPQWRPNTNNNQPLFPIQPDIAPSFGGRNFWPPGSVGQQVAPPPVPPPVPPPPPPLPPVSSQSSHMPPQYSTSSFQHPPIDKRMMNTSFNTSIPSLMDLPSSYGPNTVSPPVPPVPSVPILPVEPISIPTANIPSGNNANAKRRKIPAWIREELSRHEKEKEKKMHNTSNNNLSMNDSSSKFDVDDEEDSENEKNDRVMNESPTTFNDDGEEEENEDEETEESSSALISSTPIVNRRSRFDDDNSTEQQQLNVSAISKRAYSPSSPPPPPPTSSTTLTTTLIDDDPVDKEEQFMIKLRRSLTELLLEVTNEELALLAKEVYLDCKTESSTPVIRKASGLTSLVQSFSGSDSDDEEKHVQSIINTTVINKSSVTRPAKENNVSNSSTKSTNKTFDEDVKSSKSKKKKSSREKSPTTSLSTSYDYKDKKYHHKKHRHRSSSSSSNSSQSRSQKRRKSSNHNEHLDYNKSKKYDDRKPIILFFLNLTQWFHRGIVRFISRSRYTITINIDVIRNDSWNINTSQVDKIQFNKPTKVLAIIVNEHIPDSDLWKFIVNSIIFFQNLNIQHLIIYDYEGYIKARKASIMDYVRTYNKKNQSSLPLPTIHFLSLIDCSQTLTQVAQTLCQQVKQGDIKCDSIQIDTVDHCYTKISTIPEINLALIIGPIKSSLGLHPWLTRLTEFITIDSYKQIQTTNSFNNIVQRYNQIEQRQGR
ncbi:unnamed protein product [Adineta steineri]|uniref:ditrans,polycis-polyprenyl diphosphate synthase [(2E,6E)-farnesyldiphosphate specific] n=1 Tax=Adineta steineri TaxID=433720 RepID=A0A818N574_9BILA|nr:unnamed protein product [Adineta steineri]CAF3599411.1 unnamed protein product [Adineta steineri]CAF3814827.1 unnamed protein product [Adineta steineri]